MTKPLAQGGAGAVVLSIAVAAASLAHTAGPQVSQQPLVRPETRITVDDATRNEPWWSRYNRALDVIKKEQYEAAITLLKTAIAIDPVDQADRRIAKGITQDYFPRYYLFIAYLKTGQPAKARECYDARGPLTLRLAAEAQIYREELMKAEQKD